MISGMLRLSFSLVLLGSAAWGQTPTITINSVAGTGGAGRGSALAVGSLAGIFGSGLASGLATAATVPLSSMLDDVTSVTFNGTSAPLLLVSDGQINVQIPWEVGPGQVAVVVNRTGGSSNTMNVQVSQFAPALAAFNLGTLQAVAVNADGTLVAAAGAILGVSCHPATAGDTITLLATGLGPVSNQPADGSPAADNSVQTMNTPTVLIGGVGANVTWAGLSTQYVGVYQLQVVVPSGTATGSAVPVQVEVGGVSSSDPVTIALQ
jgi:uncharacterized protein (TIGR03437 family)